MVCRATPHLYIYVSRFAGIHSFAGWGVWLVVVLFGVAPGFGGGHEAEAFLFHVDHHSFVVRLVFAVLFFIAKEKRKKENVAPKLEPVGWVCNMFLVASPP